MRALRALLPCAAAASFPSRTRSSCRAASSSARLSLRWRKAGPAEAATMGMPACAGSNTDGMEAAMNVDTQSHLTVLRGMLAFQLNEAQAELRSLQRDYATVPAEPRVREPIDRKEEAGAGVRDRGCGDRAPVARGGAVRARVAAIGPGTLWRLHRLRRADSLASPDGAGLGRALRGLPTGVREDDLRTRWTSVSRLALA